MEYQSFLWNLIGADSLVSFKGGIDGDITLFDFIIQFDGKFDSKGIETAERFKPIIDSLVELRKRLLKNLDLIMYYPVLTFGADEEIRKDMLEYLDAWARLYSAFCKNEPVMREISAGSTSFIARALLLLDPSINPLHHQILFSYY